MCDESFQLSESVALVTLTCTAGVIGLLSTHIICQRAQGEARIDKPPVCSCSVYGLNGDWVKVST